MPASASPSSKASTACLLRKLVSVRILVMTVVILPLSPTLGALICAECAYPKNLRVVDNISNAVSSLNQP